MIIAHSNYITTSTTIAAVAGTTFTTARPLVDARLPLLAKTARSVGDEDVGFTVTFGAAKAVGLVALDNLNLSATATVRVRGYNAANELVAGSDSGLVAGNHYSDFRGFWYWLFNADLSIKSLRFDIDDPANADGYIQFGRVFAGAALRYENVEFGGEGWDVEDRADIEKTPSGVDNATAYPTLRAVSAGIVSELGDGMDTFRLLRRVGKTGEVVYVRYTPVYTDVGGVKVPDEGSAVMAWLGKLTEWTPLTTPSYGRFSGGFTVAEVAI